MKIQCKTCQRELNVKDFYKSSLKKTRICIDCTKKKSSEYQKNNKDSVNEKNRSYYARHPEKMKAYGKEYRLRTIERRHAQEKARRHAIKVETFHYYSSGLIQCDCCHESHIEFLALDHINGNGSAERKELKKIHCDHGDKFYAYLKRKGYPEGYRVLCHNCNFASGHFDRCPHQNV